MATISNKIVTPPVNGLKLLPAEDRQFCLDLYNKYKLVYRSLLAMASHTQHIYDRLPDKDNISYNNPFNTCNRFMNASVSRQNQMIRSVNKEFPARLRHYFADKYRYNFTLSDYCDQLHFISVEKLNGFAAEIIGQKGPDLQALGKRLLRHEVRFIIKEDKCRLKLKDDTITFSHFMPVVRCQREDSYLLYDKQRLPVLLRLLSMSHGDPLVLDSDEQALADSLGFLNRVRFDVTYQAFGRYSLHFYKNGRLDLTFPGAASAKKFMDVLTSPDQDPPAAG